MYHIIVNPSSGGKKAQRQLHTFVRILESRGAEYIVHSTSRPGEARELAAALTRKADCGQAKSPELTAEAAVSQADKPVCPVQGEGAASSLCGAPEPEIIVVGGDGTLHEVLNGLSDPSACRLGLIPAGTGNDFAAAAGIPLNAEEAAGLILDGGTKETDYLKIGDLRCMNVGGMGMDVDVLVRCKKGKIKGKIKYFLSLLQSLFAFKGYRVTIESEGRKEEHRALIAVACNGRQIGGGIRICPASVIDDGKIDVMAVDCLSKRQILRVFGYLMKGKVLEYPAAEHFRCERVKITPSQPCTVQMDGELYDGVDFDVSIGRGLKMYRP